MGLGTIKTDVRLICLIKMYCSKHNLKVQDFVRLLSDRDKHFQEFVEWTKTYDLK